MQTLAHFAYTLNGVDKTVMYAYDGLSRVKNAKYYAGTTPTGTPADEYSYTFDVAGNRLSESHSVNGATPTVTSYTYNSANRLTNTGYTYDANGNLTSNGVSSYTWDRANRLLSHDGISYAYDGLNNRVSQNNGVDVTEYLLDIQPSLAVVLRQKIGSQNTHYVHGLRGVQSQVANSAWTEELSDGLGSVRGWLDGSQNFVSDVDYNPYGVPDSAVKGFGFTGEMTDANGLVYLRARYYDPNAGVFASLDPFEGIHSRPMSVNGYSWVEGDVANWSDASGLSPSYPDDVIGKCQNDCTYDPCSYNAHEIIGYDENGNIVQPSGHIQTTCRNISDGRTAQFTRCLATCHRHHGSGSFQEYWKNRLEATIVDQIISSASEPIPDNPCAKPYKGGLYLEGAVMSMGLGFALIGGRERVWDFANMQVSDFSFTGISGGLIAGASFGI